MFFSWDCSSGHLEALLQLVLVGSDEFFVASVLKLEKDIAAKQTLVC